MSETSFREIGVFELGRLLLLPGTTSHFRIFEPRYCQMLKDALLTNRKFALGVTLDAEGSSSSLGIHPQGCLGHIEECRHDADGTFRIKMRGEEEIQFLEEVDSDRLYRRFRFARRGRRDGRELAEASMMPVMHNLLDWIVANATAQEAETWASTLKTSSFEHLINQLCVAFPFGTDEQGALMACEGGIPRAHLLLEFSSHLFKKDFLELEKTLN